MDIETAARTLESSLAANKGFKHLRVKKRAQSLTVFSGDPKDPWLHARLTRTRTTRDVWNLSFSNHRGRWEKTPFVGSLRELSAMLARDFRFLLQDFDRYK